MTLNQSYLSCNPSGYCQLISYKLHLLKYADDIVLLANSREGLQNSINRLEEFCDGWNLSINIEKNYKVLIFNKPAHRTQFLVYGKSLEQVKEYKYLGVMFSENSIFKYTPRVLVNQANKALFSLTKTLSDLFYPKPSLMCYLIDLLVTLIMNYMSQKHGIILSQTIMIV